MTLREFIDTNNTGEIGYVVRISDTKAYRMFYDKNGYMYYQGSDGQMHEWCHVWASGNVEHINKDSIPDIYAVGEEIAQNKEITNSNITVLDVVDVKKNNVIYSSSPMALNMVEVGTLNGNSAEELFGEFASYDKTGEAYGRIYVDSTTGNIYAKLENGFVQLSGIVDGSDVPLTVYNYKKATALTFINSDAFNCHEHNITGTSFNIDETKLSNVEVAAGDNGVTEVEMDPRFADDYELVGVNKQGELIVKKKDGSVGLYLIRDGEAIHIRELNGEGYDHDIVDDDGNKLGFKGSDINYNVKAVIPESETGGVTPEDNPTEPEVGGINYDTDPRFILPKDYFVYDEEKVGELILQLNNSATARRDYIKSIFEKIDKLQEYWDGTVYENFKEKSYQYKKALDDYPTILNQFADCLENIKSSGNNISSTVASVKNNVETH